MKNFQRTLLNSCSSLRKVHGEEALLVFCTATMRSRHFYVNAMERSQLKDTNKQYFIKNWDREASLNRRQELIRMVSEEIQESQSMYLSSEDIGILRKQLNLEEKLSMEEMRDLLTVCRYYMRHVRKDSKGEPLPSSATQAQSSHTEANNKRALVRQHLEQSPHQSNLPLICEELRHKVDLSRDNLYRLVYAEWRRLQRRCITKEHHALVGSHVEKYPAPHDIGQLCQELQHQVNLPRDALYSLVRTCSEAVSRNSITSAQRQAVKQHIDQQSTHCGDIPRLCDELQLVIDLPRRTLYTLARDYCRTLSRRNITNEQREIVRQHLRQYGPHSSQPGDMSQLYDELQRKIQVPRDALYSLVHSESRRMVRRRRLLLDGGSSAAG
mmetsp:Transcript_7624/g.28579  ORF Transcript_7624/g.28579 Transcript_7624/m.28579 type:complete len:383 (+) Transcript_7624:2078-3226(+)